MYLFRRLRCWLTGHHFVPFPGEGFVYVKTDMGMHLGMRRGCSRCPAVKIITRFGEE